MKMIDVFTKLANDEIKEDTRLEFIGESYVFDGNSFVNNVDECVEDVYTLDSEFLNKEAELIIPQHYCLKMPNSKYLLAVFNDEIFFEKEVFLKDPLPAVEYKFTKKEIERFEILAPYRDFEWSEYRESMDS